MNLDVRIRSLIESQQSLGRKIERLYESAIEQSKRIRAHEEVIQNESRRFRTALRA